MKDPIMNQQKPQAPQGAPTLKMPEQTLLQGREYTPAAGTDVQATWRKFGWVPPSVQKGSKA